MTPSDLSAIAGIILSLLFSYVPGFQNWYDPLSANLKRIIMLGLIILAAVAIFGLSCINVPVTGSTITCDIPGIWGLVKTFISCLVTNQAAYLLSPKKAKV